MIGPLTTFIKSYRDFWNDICPNVAKLLKVVNQGLRASPLRVPLAAENRSIAGPLGTAVDYYVGWTTGAALLDQAERMAKLNEDARIITGLVATRLLALRNKPQLLPAEMEHLGCLCLVLAQRAGACGACCGVVCPCRTSPCASDPVAASDLQSCLRRVWDPHQRLGRGSGRRRNALRRQM